MVEMSEEMNRYMEEIQKEVDNCYRIANQAREQGLDPEKYIESPQAKDLAGRVEKLVGPKGVANVIRTLKEKGKTDDEIVFKVVSDILDKKIGNIEDLNDRVDRAIRVGLAIKTMGVVSAPLEGISKISIRTDHEGKKYLSLYFAGPIRAAGGTTAGLCVLIADFVRRKSNIPKYKATDGEIGRYVEEVKLYDRRVHLQYPSSNNEIRFAVDHLPIEINGDSTENEEVSAFRDLPRVETNSIRGGACLVLNDGILLKAPKLLKIANKMNLEGWEWLKELKKVAQKDSDQDKKEKNQEANHNNNKIAPNSKYVADIIAGRPVFSYPSKIGGHRIRYGRSRNTGLAAGGFHPATMVLLDNFVAIGTQLRIERPGKSTSICPVSAIEPPIVKLKDGDVIKISSMQMAEKAFPKIEKILFLGDILFGYGEFAENNHKLLPSGYVEEWWALDLKKAMEERKIESPKLEEFVKNPFSNIPTAEHALKISMDLNVPLHPTYTDFWGNLSLDEVKRLHKALHKAYSKSDNTIELKNEQEIKKILEKALIIHKVKEDSIYFSKAMDSVYIEIFNLKNPNIIETDEDLTVFSYFYKQSSIKIKNKAPYYMGSRMGRPEKSERKSMKGIHTLFPLSDEVGNSRLVEKALELRKVKIDVCRKKCLNCGKVTIFNKCSNCETHTQLQKICIKCRKLFDTGYEECPQCQTRLNYSEEALFNIDKHLRKITKSLNLTLPDKMKGIFGLTNRYKVPEPIEKGILRAKNGVLVYKTAEIRYDATDIPLTHFKPSEIGISLQKLRDLGYTHDYKGEALHSRDQIIEIKVQDVILSDDCAEYLVKVANFLDDELDLFYQMPRYYHVDSKSDLIGHLVVGLAPHTSAGIIGRIIGFSPARSIYAHPFWHASKRRNCFPGDTEILIDFNNKVKKLSLKNLYEIHFKEEYFDKMAYVKEKCDENIQVYSFDKESAKVRRTNIKNIIKIPYYKKLIKFKLFDGRSFQTTLDHPVIVYSNGELIEKKAFNVKKTDKFLLPSLEFPIEDKKQFDLIYEFRKEKFKDIWKDLMVRDIKDFVHNLISILGLKKTAERLQINKKTLNNYYGSCDSIPFKVLVRLLNLHNLSIKEIPDCCLGFKQDHTKIKRFIPVDESLMKICGYYLAEGFYRKYHDGYHIDLAVSKNGLRNEMLDSIKSSFGEVIGPYVNENKITISNRVLYHFFKDILKFKNKARLKGIPALFYKFPKEKITYLLAAYFSGGGGLDICHKTVVCSSFSSRLIHDLDLMLLRFGIFSAISRYTRNDKVEYFLRIQGENVFKFQKRINFTSIRKSEGLKNIIKIKNLRPEETYKNHKLLGIRKIKEIPPKEGFIYSLNAEKYHTILVNENIMTHQCDGDEDGIMLLLDPLLNFSRHYLPSKIGGRMDATLVIGTFLDPKEIDTEAHNVDTLFQYPLEFYEATERYASPNEIEEIMDLVKNRLGTEGQYEHIGYNIPTDNINAGPTTTAYKLHESMDEKIEAQLHLAKIIQSVEAKAVAKKILSSHFNPDILGNLRKFALQEFRCVKCNTKYRRPPLSNMGKCPKCGGNVILTVNRGGIEKYIPRALKLCEEFNLDEYTCQRMELIEDYVTSLTNNPRIKQQKLSDFF
ncbi:MAG: DNA-directed DNA polymerase II large subunit [Candidatus Lokiarchaeota archaeon]|nr:DNA-directed DNA polymerase II large subunit [Candidatus Lokiarchaeota archaeon]